MFFNQHIFGIPMYWQMQKGFREYVFQKEVKSMKKATLTKIIGSALAVALCVPILLNAPMVSSAAESSVSGNVPDDSVSGNVPDLSLIHI